MLSPIQADYERHLLEPSRKVRDDVEKEWKTKVDKLEAQLESKKIWANRLDENFRAVTTENKQLVEVSAARTLVFVMILATRSSLVSGFPGVDADESSAAVQGRRVKGASDHGVGQHRTAGRPGPEQSVA